jgi:hypothetical protein
MEFTFLWSFDILEIKYKQQCDTVISRSIVLSEVTKEIMFDKQVLETMGVGLELPITSNIDNVGAIQLSITHSL